MPLPLRLPLAGLLLAVALQASEAWRSSLYPEDWTPPAAGTPAPFLHDFSYAGYHYGETEPPRPAEGLIDATRPPYAADPTGGTDSTAAIQRALDDAGAAGGGVVFLPPGTYRVAPPGDAPAALALRHDGVVLRGAGPGLTFLFNTRTDMRARHVVELQPDNPAPWYPDNEPAAASPLREDLPAAATVVAVADASVFAAGAPVLVRADCTQRFIDALGMTGRWTEENMRGRGLVFSRRIVSVDTRERTLTLDVPVRHRLLKADRARVVRLDGRILREAGVESLSIGMRAHPGEGWAENDYRTPGTGGYDAHLAKAVMVRFAENCWVRDVRSYAPPGNPDGIHLLSRGVTLGQSRLVTVSGCDFRHPQYRGAGGNGYMYTLQGNDCLVTGSTAATGRHNYSISTMAGSGNVITGCRSLDGDRESDFHMHYAVANLIDRMTFEGDSFYAQYRGSGTVTHGVTTTESVFWNAVGLRAGRRARHLIVSRQFGTGYVIGTGGPAAQVAADEDDFVEGADRGGSLEPRSLYSDQLARRLAGGAR